MCPILSKAVQRASLVLFAIEVTVLVMREHDAFKLDHSKSFRKAFKRFPSVQQRSKKFERGLNGVSNLKRGVQTPLASMLDTFKAFLTAFKRCSLRPQVVLIHRSKKYHKAF